MVKGAPRLLFAFALALLSAFGCSKTAEDPDTLVIGNGTEPETLDPGLESSQPDYRVTIGLFEGLTVYDPKDLSLKPGVAESWDVSKDRTQYTFHLRQAKWSNGDPVTSRDFEWSWKRVLDPAFASKYVEQISNYLKNAKAYFNGASADSILEGWSESTSEQRAEDAPKLVELVQKRHVKALKRCIEREKNETVAKHLRKAAEEAAGHDDVPLDQVGVTATDDRTLLVTLEAPTAYFLDLAAFFTYFPVHRKSVEAYGKNWTRPGNLVSNGPFLLKEWRIKDYILLEKNRAYWDAANVAELKLKFLPIENATTAFNLYEKGRIQWLNDVPRDYVEELVKRPDYHTGPMLTTYFYGFNLKKDVLGRKKVRQALARAIDKEKITKHVSRAGEIPASSFVPSGIVPPGMPAYTPAPTHPYDPEGARALLAEAGYPDGKGFPKFEILYNTQEGHRQIASAIQEMWRETLHIETVLRNVEFKVMLEMQNRMEFDVTRRAWIADYNDPNTFLDMFTTTNGQNNTGFSNAEYDRLIEAAGKELDPARRMQLLHDAEAILMEELPIVPIYFYVTKNLLKPEVTGFFDNVRDTHPYNRIRLAGKPPK
ncbi:MAG TPA: peptide ABC transporter substrate-binding protein [Planctomycetota bacterium]|nr:peptide ABC transporter substrate-binding protein [Planctomycetota bacterium]